METTTNETVTDETILAYAKARGFNRDITIQRGVGLYDFVRVSGWSAGMHCWTFMDLAPKHFGVDEEPTVALPRETMSALVFAKAAVLALALLAGAAGCHATAPAPEPETVGQLSASYGSVRSAPVHASTDLSPGFQAIDSDDVPGVDVAAGETVEAPDVVAKGCGLRAGEVR